MASGVPPKVPVQISEGEWSYLCSRKITDDKAKKVDQGGGWCCYVGSRVQGPSRCRG